MDVEGVDTGFAERLKQIIGEESVRSFGRRSGVSEKQLRKYLSGVSKPGLDNLVGIAAAAGVTVQWLATGEEVARILASGDSHEPSMQAMKILELIDSLTEDNRREILHRIESLHEADRNAQKLRKLEDLITKLEKRVG